VYLLLYILFLTKKYCIMKKVLSLFLATTFLAATAHAVRITNEPSGNGSTWVTVCTASSCSVAEPLSEGETFAYGGGFNDPAVSFIITYVSPNGWRTTTWIVNASDVDAAGEGGLLYS